LRGEHFDLFSDALVGLEIFFDAHRESLTQKLDEGRMTKGTSNPINLEPRAFEFPCAIRPLPFARLLVDFLKVKLILI
jgi:hypothetical protein